MNTFSHTSTISAPFSDAHISDTDAAEGENPVIKRYRPEDHFTITYYWGPPLKDFNEQTVLQMKAAGFDTIPLQRFPNDVPAIKAALALLRKHGLSAAVADGRITALYEAKEAPSQEQIDNTVYETAADYSEFDNIREWILCDEPTAHKFSVLSMIVNAVRRIDPQRKTFINLLPVYAPAELLGVPSYREYIHSFCQTVKPDYLCYDYYDFLGEASTEQRRGSYFENIRFIKEAADEYGIEARIILLVTKHGPYSNVTPEEISWQANTALLTGMKGISYFTYWEPDDPSYSWSEAMTDINGRLTQHYCDVTRVNKQVRVLGEALFQTTPDKLFKCRLSQSACAEQPIGAEEYIVPYSWLGKIKAEDIMISLFRNGWAMLMNISALKEDVRTVNIENISQALLWLNSDTGKWESLSTCPFIASDNTGEYVITLQAGCSVLIRTQSQ